MTLDELLSEAHQAAKDGALLELPGLDAVDLIQDVVDYQAGLIRLEKLLGVPPDAAPCFAELIDRLVDRIKGLEAEDRIATTTILNQQARIEALEAYVAGTGPCPPLGAR